MKTRLLWCVVVAIVVGTWVARGQTTGNPPILVPGHYLVSTFQTLPYHAIQPTEVRAVNGVLVWHMAVYDLNDVYQGERIINWGLASDVVMVPARDYDDDGLDDPTVYRESDQTWYVLRSGECGGQPYNCASFYTVP